MQQKFRGSEEHSRIYINCKINEYLLVCSTTFRFLSETLTVSKMNRKTVHGSTHRKAVQGSTSLANARKKSDITYVLFELKMQVG